MYEPLKADWFRSHLKVALFQHIQLVYALVFLLLTLYIFSDRFLIITNRGHMESSGPKMHPPR
jgi:hypothetical protein